MWWIVAAVVLGGTASAMQAPINAALARELGGTIPAVVVSFGVGFLVLLVVGQFGQRKGHAAAYSRCCDLPRRAPARGC